jgi:hypothetical protein
MCGRSYQYARGVSIAISMTHLELQMLQESIGRVHIFLSGQNEIRALSDLELRLWSIIGRQQAVGLRATLLKGHSAEWPLPFEGW